MDERIWTDRPVTPDNPISLPGCVIALESAPHLSLVSGNLEMALKHLCPEASLLGLGEIPNSKSFAIRTARDQAVLVTPEHLDRADGWQPEGLAFSHADDRYAALSVRGSSAEEVLCRGLHSDLPRGSCSCAVRFAQRTVLVTGLPNGFTLWVDQAELTYLSTFLAGTGRD